MRKRLPSSAIAEPQQTRWEPLDGGPAGIRVISTNEVIEWESLKPEIETKILKQVVQVPSGSTVEVRDFVGRKNWIVAVVAPDGSTVANIWFGPDPKNRWKFDGLVRVGSAGGTPAVWQTFQRYSDGSYRRQ